MYPWFMFSYDKRIKAGFLDPKLSASGRISLLFLS